MGKTSCPRLKFSLLNQWNIYIYDVLSYTTKVFANMTWRHTTFMPNPGRSLRKHNSMEIERITRSNTRRLGHAWCYWRQEGQEENQSSKQRRYFHRITGCIWIYEPGLQQIVPIEDWSLQPYTRMYPNQLYGRYSIVCITGGWQKQHMWCIIIMQI